MVRVNRSELTKLEIIRYATKKILDTGYSNTQVRAIAKELNMSPGNLTFHYRTKEDMLEFTEPSYTGVPTSIRFPSKS